MHHGGRRIISLGRGLRSTVSLKGNEGGGKACPKDWRTGTAVYAGARERSLVSKSPSSASRNVGFSKSE